MTIDIGIDPHKATHTAVAIDETEQPLARFQLAADRCQAMRLLAWRPRSRTGRGRSSPPTGSASCCPSSSSPRVNTSSTCPPPSQRRSGCSARRRRRRTTPTMPCRRRSPGCAIVGCARSWPTITARRSGCSSVASAVTARRHPGGVPAARRAHRAHPRRTAPQTQGRSALRCAAPGPHGQPRRRGPARPSPPSWSSTCAAATASSSSSGSGSSTRSTPSGTTLSWSGTGPDHPGIPGSVRPRSARPRRPRADRFAAYNGTAPSKRRRARRLRTG